MNPNDENNQVIGSFNSLHLDPKKIIVSYLNLLDTKNFALSSKATFFAAKNRLDQIKLELEQFLTLVAYGEQDKASELLNNCYSKLNVSPASLLFNLATFTDYSGRTFHCTAYEYAYWAKDTHMCRMLATYMNINTKKAMFIKCEIIELDGLSYQHSGKNFISKHFDFTPLKDALKIYKDGCRELFKAEKYSDVDELWLKIGLAQRDVPAHVAHEYCKNNYSIDRSLWFKNPSLPRVLEFNEWGSFGDHSTKGYWFPLPTDKDTGLGYEFSIRVNFSRGAQALIGRAALCDANDMLEFINYLDKARDDDLLHLHNDLLTKEATNQSNENINNKRPLEHDDVEQPFKFAKS